MDKEQIKAIRFDGHIRGKYFEGEHLDGSQMKGYGIYQCDDGEIVFYGDFSISGKLCDREDVGDLIESHNETEFDLMVD